MGKSQHRSGLQPRLREPHAHVSLPAGLSDISVKTLLCTWRLTRPRAMRLFFLLGLWAEEAE